MAAGEVRTVSTAWAVFSVLAGSLLGACIGTAVAFWTQKRTPAAAKAQRDGDSYQERPSLERRLNLLRSRGRPTA